MINNRVTESIHSGLEKGESLYIFYGDYIHDWFLYDLYHGMMELKEAYKRLFLIDRKFDYFVYLRNSIFEVYKLKNDNFALTSELIEGRISADDPLAGLVSPAGGSADRKEENKAQQVAEAAAEPNKAGLMKVIDYCKKNPATKTAFFFEDFEWTSGLYKSSNDGELVFIEKLREISNLKNCVVTVSVADAEMLSKYHFDIKGKNVQILGSPAVNEIWQAYIRTYFRRYHQKISKEKFLELYLIAEAIGAGDKSLMEAMRIFDKVMAENGGTICKKDFESALEKQIEEKVGLDDVVMSDGTKAEITERIDTFLQAEEVSSITKGMILTGPPGTGKTFIVKALANEKNCYFMSPSLGELKGEYVGQTSGKVRRIFQQARANAPTILFIDEADTVFPSRDAGMQDTDSFMKDMVNQFLVEMDGLTTGNSKVFVIAATNRVSVLDSAIKSRLGTPIAIPLPDKEQRKQLFASHLRKMDVEKFCKLYFFDEFIDKTNRMSGRDIKNFTASLDTEAKSRTRTLQDYTGEAETRELFYSALKHYERDLIRDLEGKLHLTIKQPDPKLNYDSIIGCENVKRAIDKQLRMFDPAERQLAKDYHITPGRGILLYGPPGNGKSQMAEAAASHNNLLFMKVTSDTFLKTSLSEQSQTLVKIFSSALQLSELCSEQKGVLLFFDEFDSLVSTTILDSRIRGTMLTQLDDKETMRNPAVKVIFVAATNFLDRLDEAVTRPGRIDEKILMSDPTPEEAERMIIQFCKRNSRVQPLRDGEAKKIYEKLVETLEKREEKREFELCKRQWIAEGKSPEELKKSLAEEIEGTIHPSGATLRTLVDKLIENAYDRRAIDENTKELVIREDIIQDVLEIEE